ETAVRGEIVRRERDRLAVDADGTAALLRLRERGAAVEQHAERGGLVLLLDQDLREPTVSTLGSRKMRHQIAELLLGLTKAPSLETLQPRREGDLVVEVSRSARHSRSVCAVC